MYHQTSFFYTNFYITLLMNSGLKAEVEKHSIEGSTFTHSRQRIGYGQTC